MRTSSSLRFDLCRLAVIVLTCASQGCAATTPEPVALPVAIEEAVAIDPGPLSMEGEIGGMNEEAVEKAFASLEGNVFGCVERGTSRVRELGGHFDLSLRIDRDGHARWAYLSASTLGDRDTEKCVLDAARARTWPRPVGGEGLASRSFDVDPNAEPITWDEKRVRPAVRGAAGRLSKCRGGIEGSFVATMYVRPDGRVASAGVAPPSATGEDAADCLADQIERFRFRSPGRRSAKVTFAVP